MRAKDLETPCLVVDLDILERNIERMQVHLSRNGIACRPHVKTHKIPAIAHLQMEAGATGITCQKLSEAEVMINAGLRDVLLAYNIIGVAKLRRLIRLAQQARIMVVADSSVTVDGLASAADEAGITLSVMVECDTGARRAGVQTPEEAVDLATRIDASSSLDFAGLMTFKGGAPDPDHVLSSGRYFEATISLLKDRGIDPRTVSSGGTVYAPLAWPDNPPFGVNECRPGVYVYNDCVKVSFGVAALDDCAMRVLATVVSRPTSTRGIVDAGSKALANDGFQWVDGFGHVLELPDARIDRLSEEHGVLESLESRSSPAIGDRVTIIPNYSNTVTNIHDVAYGIRGGIVETVWPISARGAIL